VKVYLQPPQPSLGLDRIATALRRYAPLTVEVCEFPRNVDLTVIYAIGRRDHIQRQVDEILSRDKNYAIIQVCLRSTMSPSTDDWAYPIWTYAKVIWSYYDLNRAIAEDGLSDNWEHGKLGNFLHSSSGVDAQVCRYRGTPVHYVVTTSGYSRRSESVRECWLAAEQVGGCVAHLGPLKPAKHVAAITNVSDDRLAEIYSASMFVSGLRRTEGFELPAAEGLLCGARPLLFDTADYRWNYKDWGVYVKEGTRQEVVDQLVEVFKQGAAPVTADERSEAAHWFNWERVCGEFWQRCLQ